VRGWWEKSECGINLMHLGLDLSVSIFLGIVRGQGATPGPGPFLANKYGGLPPGYELIIR